VPAELRGKELTAELEFENIPFKLEKKKVTFNAAKEDAP
jgi:hypothetical protein